MTAQNLLTPAEAAQRLCISKDTVLVWAKARKLPSLRLGPKTIRFSEADIRAFLDRASDQQRAGE